MHIKFNVTPCAMVRTSQGANAVSRCICPADTWGWTGICLQVETVRPGQGNFFSVANLQQPKPLCRVQQPDRPLSNHDKQEPPTKATRTSLDAALANTHQPERSNAALPHHGCRLIQARGGRKSQPSYFTGTLYLF